MNLDYTLIVLEEKYINIPIDVVTGDCFIHVIFIAMRYTLIYTDC